MTSHWENVLTPAGDGGWPEVTRRRDLGRDDLRHLDLRWRAANYLSVGQIYLMDNPLLREPLRAEHVKPRLLGHWGTTPGLNFIHAHLNRAIVERDVEMMHVMGPGHGGPAAVASSYLDGTWSEIYPDVGQDEDGLRKLFRQFSFPGGIPSHAAPEVPGSIHEGGELGYSISHAFGAAFDNPDLVVATVVGDGEAETGPLATSWHSTKFLDPRRDGAVLPILHLNGYKIANPTVLSAIAEDELWSLLRGGGWAPYVVAGSDPEVMHHSFATTLDHCLDEIASIQHEAREAPAGEPAPRRPWPMIVLRSPKGWTGPGQVDGDVVEDHWRAHQVPFKVDGDDDDHLQLLEQWLRSYRPEELFDAAGHVIEDVTAISPAGNRRMSASPHANGGLLRRELDLPDFTEYAVEVGRRGGVDASATGVLAGYLRDTLRDNDDAFRIFAPDELGSNRLDAVLEATDRTWNAALGPHDTNLSPGGRVMEVLSEHLCQGWLEGYLLTGRHGLFTSYEAFAHIVGSMFNQHAKWIDAASDLPWRRPISSFTYLLTSHVWRQDHNGFTHQDPGFIDHVVTKKADVVRVYLPPDANTLLTVADRCLRSQDRVNVVVAGKQEALQYLPMSEAVDHVERGIGAWSWASNDDGDPDVVMACAGDIATMETLAAVSLLHEAFPQLRVRVVNAVDLMRLQDDRTHPHGLSDDAFDDLFTTDRPIIMAYHGYPWLIHRLTHRRTNHANLHVHGYVEEGTTTTPFDMSVRNGLDRFHLVLDVIDRVPDLPDASVHAREMREHLRRHGEYVTEHGDDMPEVRNWRWPGQ